MLRTSHQNNIITISETMDYNFDLKENELFGDEIKAVEYNSQDKALEHLGDGILVKKTMFKFIPLQNQQDFAELIMQTPKNQRNFYEVLQENKPQKLFADIDGVNLGTVDFINKWEKFLSVELPKVGIKYDREKSLYLDSSKDGKLSLHWCYNNGISFKTCDEQKQLWKYLETVVEDKYGDFCYTKTHDDGTISLASVIDISVYSKNRPMRTIFSHKKGSTRVLKPVVLKNGKLVNKRLPNITDYFIFTPKCKTFYKLKCPSHPNFKNSRHNVDDVENYIYNAVPNVVIDKRDGRLFKLKNKGVRKCIIGGEENKSDNSYVIWKRDGLYFGCHDAHCKGELRKIKDIKELSISEEDKNIQYFCDYTYFIDQERTVECALKWVNNCLVMINNGGKSFIMTKNKHIDPETNESSILYTQLEPRVLLSNLTVACKLLNPSFNADKEESDDNPKYNYISMGNNLSNKQKGFLADVILHRKLPTFNNPDFYPFLKSKGEPKLYKSFNMFVGFPMEDVELKQKHNFTKSKIYSHILNELMNGNEGEFNHFLDFIADIIQCPATIRGPSHLFYTEQGMGKGMVAKFLTRLIGSNYVSTIIDTKRYFEKFNSQYTCKLLKIFEELKSKGSAFDNNDRLKGEQTNPTEKVEPKGVDAYTTRHCARYMYFTNNANALYIESNCRRHTLHKANNRYANNTEYFDPIWKEIKDEQFCKSAFEFFAARKYEIKNVLTAYNTKYKNEQKFVNIPNAMKFMVESIEDNFSEAKCEYKDDSCIITVKDLHEEYKKWCNNNGCRYHISNAKQQFEKMGIPEPTRMKIFEFRKKCYLIDYKAIEKTFGRYIRDENFKFDIGEDEIDLINPYQN